MILAQAQTPGLLHCDITNWFWVRWINGSIEVGRGMTVGDEIFMRTFKSVSTENLHQISIQSDVVSNEAFFQIRNFEGKPIIVKVSSSKCNVLFMNVYLYS